MTNYCTHDEDPHVRTARRVWQQVRDRLVDARNRNAPRWVYERHLHSDHQAREAFLAAWRGAHGKCTTDTQETTP